MLITQGFCFWTKILRICQSFKENIEWCISIYLSIFYSFVLYLSESICICIWKIGKLNFEVDSSFLQSVEIFCICVYLRLNDMVSSSQAFSYSKLLTLAVVASASVWRRPLHIFSYFVSSVLCLFSASWRHRSCILLIKIPSSQKPSACVLWIVCCSVRAKNQITKYE